MKSLSFHKSSALAVAGLLLLLGLLGALMFENARHWEDAERGIEHVQAAIGNAEKVQTLVSAAESSVRTFAITGRDDSLEPYRAAAGELDGALADLVKPEQAHPEHLRRLQPLEGLLGQRLAFFRETIRQRREHGLSAAHKLVAAGRGTRLTAQIQDLLDDFQVMERADLQRLRLESEAGSLRRSRLLAAVFLLAFFVLVAAFIAVLWGVDKRRTAERALADAHARLRGVLDSATQVAIIATDLTGAITLFNKGAETLLGWRSEEMVGLKNAVEVHLESELRERSAEMSRRLGRPVQGFAAFSALARREVPAEREWTYVRKDGTSFPVDLAVTEIRDHAGRLTGFLGMAADMSARKAAELQLRKLSTAVEASPASIVITDREGRIEYVNRKFVEITGYSFQEALGQNPRILKSGRTPPRTYQELWETVLAGREWRGEFLNRKKNGELFWELASISAVKDERGAITHFIAVKDDITARKWTEEALRESQERLRLILDSTAEAIYGVDLQGRCTFCNSACLRILGYSSQQQLLGKNMHELIHHSRTDGSFFPVQDCRIFRAFRKGEGCRVDDEVLWRADRTSLPVEYWSYPQVVGGEIKGAVVTFVDISERRQAQEAVEKARDAAVELARMKSEFLANMSHEIRTPMNAIIGMTELLLDTELSAQQLGFVKTTNSAGETLLAIINDILDYSKIESGRMSVEATDFGLREAVEGSVSLIAQKASSKGIELAYHIAEDVPDGLRGDPGRLRQVLLNLLSNAVKFTHAGEVVLRVRSAGETPAGAVLRFSVQDTGIGIPEEARGRLFQVFSQADASTTRKYGGTGLGLAISRKIVTLLGGDIGFESVPGQGSTFWFTLPFARLSGPPAREPVRTDLSGVRALVVDDNAANREIVGAHLSSWGMRWEAVDSGAQALAALRREAGGGDPFQLVVLDLQMPEMDGLMLARSIQEEPALQGVRKVLLSSLGRPAGREELAALGISACLAKPVRPSALLDALGGALGPEPSARAAAGPEAPAAAPVRDPTFRILLVEDNPVNQEVALRQIERLGYRADLAANGREALEALRRSAYDLVLMDCQMPEMDGFQATAEIRRREGGASRTPIVAMTANALEGDRERCIAAGMDDYLAKPVRLEKLAGVAARWDTTLDAAALAELRSLGGAEDPAFLARLIAVFIKDSGPRLEAVRAAVAAGDAALLGRSAHGLKGASGNIGARRMQRICRLLEKLGKSGTTTGAQELLEALAAAFAETRAALQAQRSKPDGGAASAAPDAGPRA